MNPYAKLAEELEEAGIDLRSIRINETPQDCCFCILNYEPEVECFYSERGTKYELVAFSDSESAIRHFKGWVLSMEHLHKNWSGTIGAP